MPKLKTNKSVAKRFKVTGTGKIVRKRPGRAHLMRKKNAKRKRRLALEACLTGANLRRVRTSLPYGS